MMRRLFLFLAILLVSSNSFAQLAPQPAPVREYWMGEMATGTPLNPTLSFLITLWQDGGGWKGSLDIAPAIGIGGAWGDQLLNADLTATSIELVQASATRGGQPNLFLLARDPVNPDVASGHILVGGSAEVPARMWKVDAAEARDFMPRRPQAPRPPFPYTAAEVEVPNSRNDQPYASIGVLTIPQGPGPHPAVVLVNAFDVHDADHTSMGHKPFQVLADRLARAGIASLRTADRPMMRPGLAPQVQVTLKQLGTEAAARVTWLSQQPGIDGTRTGLIGLNEGAVAAAIAAVEQPAAVRCLVMLAPQATNGIEQFRIEFAAGVRREGESSDFAEKRTESFLRPYRLLAQDAPEADVIAALNAEITMMRAARRQQVGEASPEIIAGMAQQQYLVINTPEFKNLLTFDPAVILNRVTQPVLVLIGGKDQRFGGAQTVPVFEQSLGKRAGVETQIRLKPSLNHRLQPAVSGFLDEIPQIEPTFDEAALAEIIEFLRAQLIQTGAPREVEK